MSELIGRPLLAPLSRFLAWVRRPWTTYSQIESLVAAYRESSAEIKEIRRAIAEDYRCQAPILTTEAAMKYVGVNSTRTFRRWVTRFGVKACSPGRYARTSLDQGLRKEERC